MMRIKIKSTIRLQTGQVAWPGNVIEIDSPIARHFIGLGVAEEVCDAEPEMAMVKPNVLSVGTVKKKSKSKTGRKRK